MTTTIETHTATRVSKVNFDRLTKSTYMNSMTEFGRLHFTDTGRQRFAHTLGFIEAIHVHDPEKAYELADSLCKYLDYLNEYGGTMDSPEGRTGGKDRTTIHFPRFRVSLGDDGGIGSFSVMWYYAVPHKDFMAKAEELADGHAMARHQKTYAALTREQAETVWEEALSEARAVLKLRPELELYRLYRHSWDVDNSQGMGREYVCYGFSHNGGLIFHHDRNDITRGHWSTHT